LSITTPNFALKILKAFLLGDMDSTPPLQTFSFKKWKIVDLKKIELPLLNREGRDNIFFQKNWKTITFFFKEKKNPREPCLTPEYEMVAAQALYKN
jgi:hypothetical protein